MEHFRSMYRLRTPQIDAVLETLYLQDTKDVICERLSGGQRKRLSIALELLDNRPILLLDEPTTGLDSVSAAYCIRLLRNLALEGRTIVCTIHSPAASVYDMFDQVYVLAGGRCLYQGSADNTVAYLAANGLRCPQYHNVADFGKSYNRVLYLFFKLNITQKIAICPIAFYCSL